MPASIADFHPAGRDGAIIAAGPRGIPRKESVSLLLLGGRGADCQKGF